MHTNDLSVSHQAIAQLRACGHFLYYRMGGRVGRRRILTLLSEHPNMLQKELQDTLQIQSGSLSEVIIKLEEAGLVEKGKCEKDGRQWTINLTEKGKLQAQRLKTEYNEKVLKMTECLSPEQLDVLNELLSTMLEHWNSIDLCLEQKNIKEENE